MRNSTRVAAAAPVSNTPNDIKQMDQDSSATLQVNSLIALIFRWMLMAVPFRIF